MGGVFLCLLLSLRLFCTEALRVAVIGGGMGGASFAYYYSKLNPGADITVFEASDYLGGRLKHTTMHGAWALLHGGP